MESRENESVAAQAIAPAIKLRDWFRHDVKRPLENLVGGRKRLRVVALLACVLALDAADKATVGAVAAQLESDLHIGNVQIGLLVAVSTGISALTTLPFGILVDRVHRGRLLTIAIALWSLAMIASGASVDYPMLLITRLGLGAVVALASPAIASLTGDFFHPAERGRIYGYILAGELVGTAFGFLISGNVAAILSWRASFWILAFLGLILAAVIAKLLPEPRRGGQNPIPDTTKQGREAKEAPSNEVEEIVEERDIDPRDELILHRDPLGMSVWDAVRYVLSIRTYRTLIIASALGYFYFTGLRTFAIVFVRGRFDLAQATASTFSVGVGLGAIVGVLVAGTLADKLIDRGKLTGRILVGASAYLLAATALVPGLLATSLWVASPFFFLAAAGLGGANPAVDAARLDIMHSRLWGRAEGVRSTLLYIFQAIAPPLFGWVSGVFAGRGSGAGQPGAQQGNAGGLEITFLIMLVTLAAAGVVMFRALKTYPRDVATAIASEQAAPQKEESRNRKDRRG